jgi:hypothetical protein
MSERITLSPAEIKQVLDKIPKIYHLEVYRALKTNFLSAKANKSDVKKLQEQLIKYLNHKNAPRVLTDKEIEDILSVITIIPATIKEIAEDNNRQVKEVLKRQLLKLKFSVTDDTIDRIKKDIRAKYLKSVCSGGESVGVNSATSISQKLTQATLNTFHQAGSKNNQGGLGFLNRLFRVSKPTEDNIVIHFKDKNLTQEEIKILSNNLKGVSVDHVKTNYEILDSISPEDKIWYDNYLTTMGSNFIYKGGKFLRLYLNLNHCYKYNIFINDVVKTIEYNTRSSEIKQTVKCIASSSYKGIIDIHVEPEFIKLYINKLNEKVGKNNIPFTSDIEEQSQIFLNVLLPSNFKDMIIKGVKGIEHIGISEGINLIRSFKETPVNSSADLERFSKKPYNLKFDDISRLWYIRVHKNFLYFDGISTDKYIKLFESAGFKIIENNLQDSSTSMVVLLPKKLDVNYYDKKEGKVKNLYEIDEKGIIFNKRDDKVVTGITPVTLIEEKIKFIEAQMASIIEENIKNASKVHADDLPIFPPLYRYCYYYHANIQGKNIINDLMSNNMIDGSFTYPDNVNSVCEHLGIEAARFYLINKYFQTNLAKDLNPVNIELLTDFQTGLGVLLAINSTGVNKIGNSVLSSCSYERSMDIFQEGSAFGSLDEIKGISGCIITGSNCRNGTGFNKIEYSEKYINDENNKNKGEAIKDIALETDYLIGPCYSTVPQDLNADFNKPDLQDTVLLNLPEQGKKPELCLKEDIPDPPRMEMPTFLVSRLEEENIDLEKEYENNQNYADLDILDIPDDPGQMESDYF